jgi:hypothetical protein
LNPSRPISCPETSVINYYSTLLRIPKKGQILPGDMSLVPRLSTYQLRPKVSASCVSYRDTTKGLNFASPEQTETRTLHRNERHHTQQIQTPPDVELYPMSTIQKRTRRGGKDTTHTHHGQLGRENSKGDGHRTKVLWTRFDTRAIRFLLSSMVHKCYT